VTSMFLLLLTKVCRKHIFFLNYSAVSWQQAKYRLYCCIIRL